jgi:hypothetical protein
MPLADLFHFLRERSRHHHNVNHANHKKLLRRLVDVFLRTWGLGFAAFGGPNVHFQILYQRFVVGSRGKVPWVDEQTVSNL